MNTLTIPKNLINTEDLVILSRREYEQLLRVQNNNQITIKRSASFKIKKGQEKFYDELDKDLTKAVREYKAGKVTRTFSTAKDAIKFLDSRKNFSLNK